MNEKILEGLNTNIFADTFITNYSNYSLKDASGDNGDWED